jgi:hypothetical protein
MVAAVGSAVALLFEQTIRSYHCLDA